MKCSLVGAALSCLALISGPVRSADSIAAEVDGVYPQAEKLYFELHRRPELSAYEQQTAATLAAGLRGLGYEVTTGVGRTGVVGVMKNGAGAIVLLRTDLDALPVEEKTGLPYASTVSAKDASGAEVPVMHAKKQSGQILRFPHKFFQAENRSKTHLLGDFRCKRVRRV
jgi:hypothetical protein